jgi:hypothetical protein
VGVAELRAHRPPTGVTAAHAPDVVEFITDSELLGLTLSPAQEALLRAIYALPMSEDHLELYRACTGRGAAPDEPFGEVTVIAGARSGKDSRIAAPIVLWEALFGGHESRLSKGERGVIVLVAADLRGTKVAFGYIRDYLLASRLLASKVDELLTAEITLKNGLSIQTFPSTSKSVRGWSIPVGVMDELAFFRLEGSADSDAEIQASIRRGMLAFPSPRLVKITTPYMRGGVVYEDFKHYFGQDSPDVLVWRAASALMNPSIATRRLERERRLDPERFAREYEAEFAEDVDAFLPAVWVEEATVTGRHELPPRAAVRYVAAVDPSGGGADAFTLAIVHVEGGGAERRVVQDVMPGGDVAARTSSTWPPSSARSPSWCGAITSPRPSAITMPATGCGRPFGSSASHTVRRASIAPPRTSRSSRSSPRAGLLCSIIPSSRES